MPKNNLELLDSALKKILLAIPEVKYAAIISTKGFPVKSNFTENIDDQLVSPMFATIHSIAERFMVECYDGSLNQVLIDAKKYKILIKKLDSDHILCCISENEDFLKFIPSPKRTGKIFNKIISLMEEQDTNSLVIERKYLSELFGGEILNYNTFDGLPVLTGRIEIELNSKKIEVKYKGKLIEFTKPFAHFS